MGRKRGRIPNPKSQRYKKAVAENFMKGGFLPKNELKEEETSNCIICGKEKQHNNSFCSAECCKVFKGNTK